LVFLSPLPPQLISSQTNIFVGGTFTNLLSATNSVLPEATYTFATTKSSTNGYVAGGQLAWTNRALQPGVYSLAVRITNDDSVPLILVTNRFTVTVLPLPTQLGLANASALNATGISQGFRFDISTPWSNMAFRVEAATNLDAAPADWLPVYTNPGTGGGLLFTDLLATNFPERYYRAVFP
jgi:hypothetical protein